MIKRKTAKELLTESFKDIAASKAVSKITVREIAENCGYSSATFYREFRDKYDLIAWDYAQELDRIMSRVGAAGFPWRWSLLEGANYFLSHQEYLVNLLRHTSGRDSFADCLLEANCRSLQQYIRNSAAGTETTPETMLCARVYCAGTVRLCCEWLTGQFQADPADMAGIWERSLPAVLTPYLYS